MSWFRPNAHASFSHGRFELILEGPVPCEFCSGESPLPRGRRSHINLSQRKIHSRSSKHKIQHPASNGRPAEGGAVGSCAPGGGVPPGGVPAAGVARGAGDGVPMDEGLLRGERVVGGGPTGPQGGPGTDPGISCQRKVMIVRMVSTP